MVGTSGNALERMTPVTPNARTRPPRACGAMEFKLSIIKCTWPAIRSVIAAALPDVPTIAEPGVPGYEAITWNGLIAPAGTPRDIVRRLNGVINKILISASLKEKFALIGADPQAASPEDFAALIKRENVKWAEVIKKSGAKID